MAQVLHCIIVPLYKDWESLYQLMANLKTELLTIHLWYHILSSEGLHGLD
jgi:hypothetical protein